MTQSIGLWYRLYQSRISETYLPQDCKLPFPKQFFFHSFIVSIQLSITLLPFSIQNDEKSPPQKKKKLLHLSNLKTFSQKKTRFGGLHAIENIWLIQSFSKMVTFARWQKFFFSLFSLGVTPFIASTQLQINLLPPTSLHLHGS